MMDISKYEFKGNMVGAELSDSAGNIVCYAMGNSNVILKRVDIIALAQEVNLTTEELES